jgi:ATP-dependent exoDNAse (exonuclease V) beta subunit
VLYRQHSHRDDVAAELAEQGIPFSIENMDVIDTPEVRDLFACLGAVVSERDSASLFRVAALPQFSLDPEKLRAGMRSLSKSANNAGLASVLGQIDGGTKVQETLQQTREEISQAAAKSYAAAKIVVRRFGLDDSSRPLAALLAFIAAWEDKAITRTKELAELLEYLEYFREAGGGIPMTSSDADAVSLMTAHTAKGLEWDHVFILRANSSSFPCSYKHPLVEFPAELRNEDSAAEKEGKALHDQEERRLFYVAMTRARDTLTIYARQGKGKKDPTPPGYVRELLDDAAIRNWFHKRPALAFEGELFAEASPAPAAASRTSEWLELPPASDLNQHLSPTAVEIYETCPLQFKLEREWKIPREVPAAMQYGAAVHRVLRACYDSIRLQRPLADDLMIELLRTDLAQAGIQDRYQLELYQRQGTEQLRDFLIRSRQLPRAEVLHTEEGFQLRLGGAMVSGRIDRMDRMAGGRVVITDYKTGKPKSQEDADQSLQLSIYAIAAQEKWGYEVESLIFYNLEENAPVVSYRSAAQLQEARLKVEAVAEQIAAKNFTANPGFHCGFCPYRNLCPATEKRWYGISSARPPRGRGRKRTPESN